MTLEQKEKLEKMLCDYSRKGAYCELDDKLQQAFIYQDRIRQIQEVLEVLGYKVKKEWKEFPNVISYYVYTVTG